MKKPYIPFQLPIEELIDINVFLNDLLEANRRLGEYEILLRKSKINPNLLLAPITLQEAIQSTRIEGTQVTLDDMLEYGADESMKNSDIQEVINYSDALRVGESMLSQIPISTRMIKEMHRILLSGNVRGKNRNPGEFRSTQNFIGEEGCTINNATFIPPEPHLVNDFMSNLEKYINEPTDNLNDLIRIAIIHAQFETIHPFLDGNGRIGRILIPLYLYSKNIINRPSFFMSESLEKDKFKYYKLLNDTRVVISDDEDEDQVKKDIALASQKWNNWIKFFISCAISQANKNIQLIESIDSLYNTTIDKGKNIISSHKIIDIINIMFERPIFTKKTILNRLDIPASTLTNYLNKLEEAEVIYSNDKLRNKKYYFYDLITLLRQ